jgi:hypothetical protein
MSKRYLAVTQIELNLQFSEDGAPIRNFVRAYLLDPAMAWRAQQLDLAWPGSGANVDKGQFVVSAVGDLDGDGRPELVYGVTIDPEDYYILAYRHDGVAWRAMPIIRELPSVNFVRSIALGDLDQDGLDEIVVGTRPSGAVFVLDSKATSYAVTIVDRDQYGIGTTNTREVVVADVDSDGALEILVATARVSPENWHATPGAIFLHRRSPAGWDRTLIDDHGGRTHTRMVAVADLKDDGVNRIVSCAVGVVSPESGCTDPEPELRAYTLVGGRAVCEPIGTLENMIKSRSFAAGDVDHNGRTALVVGTRALGVAGLETTCLYIFRFDHSTQAWERETLDTSGQLGFHCVIVADVDGDGLAEIVASDDERGQIKLYKREGDGWQRKTLHAANGPILCTAIHLVDVDPGRV